MSRDLLYPCATGRVSLKKNRTGQYVLRCVSWRVWDYPKNPIQLVHLAYPAEEYPAARARLYRLYEILLRQAIDQIREYPEHG